MGYIKDIVDEVKAKLLAPRPQGRGLMPMAEEPKPVAPKVIYHDSQSEAAIGIQLYLNSIESLPNVVDYYGSPAKVYADRECTKDPDWKAILSKNPYLPIYISAVQDSSDILPEEEAFVLSQTIRLDSTSRISCYMGDVTVYAGTIPCINNPEDVYAAPVLLVIGVITDPSTLEAMVSEAEIGYLTRVGGYANTGE